MHSCPVCDQACSCGGDMDDTLLDEADAQAQCTHCDEDDDFEDDDEVDPFDDIDEDEDEE